MNKSDVIAEIEKLKSKLYKDNEGRKPITPVVIHNNGGIYWLNELKFRIEKLGTKRGEDDEL